MKCVNFLTIAMLMVSATAFASDPVVPPVVSTGTSAAEAGWFDCVTDNSVYNKVKSWNDSDTYADKARLAGAGIGAGLLVWYGLSKFSSHARRAWNAVYLGKVTDKIEDTSSDALKRVKDRGISKTEGAIGTVALGTGLYFLNKRFELIGGKKASKPVI